MDPGETARLIDEYHRTGDRSLRNRVLEAHLYVADRIVPRYSASPRGNSAATISSEDLRQTARLALIGAIERYDPTAGASLCTFATRTIEGELKRFLRDRTWLVRPPRRLQENHLNIRRATEELQHEFGRIPTTEELAERVGVSAGEVRAGMLASQARTNESLDREVRIDDDSVPSTLSTLLGSLDRNFALCDDLNCLHSALKKLDDRQVEFLRMRYSEQMSQSAIAASTGVSQSYVSRVLQQAVRTLRSYFQLAA